MTGERRGKRRRPSSSVPPISSKNSESFTPSERPTGMPEANAALEHERPTTVPDDPTLEEGDRPTVVPDFDIGAFARRDQAQSLQPPPETEEVIQVHGPSHLDLEKTYREQIGSLARVPIVCVDPSELRTMPLEPAAGFLLSNMDGVSTVEMLLDLGGMPRVEALRIVYQLLKERVIELV